MRSSRKHDVNYLALVKLVTRESGGDYQLVTGVTVRVFGTAWWARTTDPQIHNKRTPNFRTFHAVRKIPITPFCTYVFRLYRCQGVSLKRTYYCNLYATSREHGLTTVRRRML